jgi:hypothetical protein
MPIVFVHGVSNRRLNVDYAEREKRTGRFLVDAFDPKLGLTLAPESVFFPYWGDHGVKFRWNQASLPSGSDPVEVLSPTSRRASEDFELCIEEARFQYGPGAVSFGQISRNKGLLKAVNLLWDVASAVMSSASSHDDLIEGYSAPLGYARENLAPFWAMFTGKAPTEPSHIHFYGKAEAPETIHTSSLRYALPYSEETLSPPLRHHRSAGSLRKTFAGHVEDRKP